MNAPRVDSGGIPPHDHTSVYASSRGGLSLGGGDTQGSNTFPLISPLMYIHVCIFSVVSAKDLGKGFVFIAFYLFLGGGSS